MKYRLWMLAALLLPPVSLLAAEPRVLFEDRFDGKLADGWTWLRENPKAWRFREGALEIRVEPGAADTVKNALVRKAPDRSKGKFAFEVTVTGLSPADPAVRAGGADPVHDGKPSSSSSRSWSTASCGSSPPRTRSPWTPKTVQLRLIVTADSFEAQFRPDAKGEFKTATKGPLPPPGKDEISIQCYNGPPEAEHWFRFDDFRILKLEE